MIWRPGLPLPLSPIPGGPTRAGRMCGVTAAPVAFPDGTEVPRGYLCDGASVPWLARPIIPAWDQHLAAALYHDWRYSVGQPGMRKAADDEFRRLLELTGLRRTRAALMHRAVRIGGGAGYAQAAAWWDDCFYDHDDGRPITPPLPREDAFTWSMA